MWISEYEDCDSKFFIVRVARERGNCEHVLSSQESHID